MDWVEGNYRITNDKSLLSIDRICDMLTTSYWARNRAREVITKSIKTSICYGVYLNGLQIGYGRIVTDYATTYYICDIIIHERHRGKGLGKKLVQCMLQDDEVKGKFGILSTKDAHSLYEKYGFRRDENTFMYRSASI